MVIYQSWVTFDKSETIAAAMNELATVALNLQDPNMRLLLSFAPLHLAQSSPALVRQLVARGANPNIKDSDSLTPLDCALFWTQHYIQVRHQELP